MTQISVIALDQIELVRDCSLALVVSRSLTPQAPDPGARQETWALLRTLLARFTSCRPESLRFGKSPQGKPCLADGGAPAFNLSHSRGYSLIALSRSGEIGCDIEDRFAHEDVTALCTPVLHPCELEAMHRLAPSERQDAFRRYWVRKEAVLKAAGSGFLRDPRQVITGLEARQPTWVGSQGLPFNIHNQRIDTDCVAAVASLDAACSWRLLKD